MTERNADTVNRETVPIDGGARNQGQEMKVTGKGKKWHEESYCTQQVDGIWNSLRAVYKVNCSVCEGSG